MDDPQDPTLPTDQDLDRVGAETFTAGNALPAAPKRRGRNRTREQRHAACPVPGCDKKPVTQHLKVHIAKGELPSTPPAARPRRGRPPKHATRASDDALKTLTQRFRSIVDDVLTVLLRVSRERDDLQRRWDRLTDHVLPPKPRR